MSTVNFSVPEDVKAAFNATFEGQNKSAVIADLMREAVERAQKKQRHVDAIDRILARRATAPRLTEAEFTVAPRSRSLVIFVVDASVAVKWFANGDWALKEDHLEPALEVLRASRREEATFLQPPHFLAEVAAVLARLMPHQANLHIRDLASLDIVWADPAFAMERAVAIATSLNHHLFDTWYHAVALHTPGAQLVTADRRYFDKAQHLGQMVWLADFESR